MWHIWPCLSLMLPAPSTNPPPWQYTSTGNPRLSSPESSLVILVIGVDIVRFKHLNSSYFRGVSPGRGPPFHSGVWCLAGHANPYSVNSLSSPSSLTSTDCRKRPGIVAKGIERNWSTLERIRRPERLPRDGWETVTFCTLSSAMILLWQSNKREIKDRWLGTISKEAEQPFQSYRRQGCLKYVCGVPGLGVIDAYSINRSSTSYSVLVHIGKQTNRIDWELRRVITRRQTACLVVRSSG
jgi:hypothetical protein